MDVEKAPRLRKWAGRFAGSLARGAETALLRFPVAALCVVAITVLGNLSIADIDIPDPQNLVWLIAALYGAAAASIAATLVGETRGAGRPTQRLAALVAAVIAGAAVYFCGRADNHLPALTSALTLAIPLAPYVGRGGPLRFWTFTLWSAVGAALAFLSVLLFMLGLSAILEMIRFLFEMGLSSTAYEHIYATAFALVGPLFAMGRLPREFDERVGTGEDRLIGGVRLLIDWVATPLALATAVILHLYAAKIALTATMPKNEIGWIVTFDALLVLSLRIAAEPFLRNGALPARLFGRLWAIMLLVPLALASLGIFMRISSEGVSIERYYVALAILAAFLVVAVQLIPKLAGDIRVMAAIPLVLLGLSAFGPWGASGLTGRSQVARIVEEFGARVPGTESIAVRPAAGRSQAAQARLRSRLYELAGADRLGDLVPYLDPEVGDRLDMALNSEPERAIAVVTDALGADVSAWTHARPRGFAAFKPGEVDLAGYDRAALHRIATPNEADAADEADGMAFRLDGGALVATLGETSDRFDLGDAIKTLPPELFSAVARQVTPPALDLRAEDGRHLRLSIRRLAQSDEGDINFLEFDAFYRSAEWR
ncbi:DUF4153 domain-containing protein [Jiella endophytica]|nr:DUF4153 domain-containing protein [Jiella endophytica]